MILIFSIINLLLLSTVSVLGLFYWQILEPVKFWFSLGAGGLLLLHAFAAHLLSKAKNPGFNPPLLLLFGLLLQLCWLWKPVLAGGLCLIYVQAFAFRLLNRESNGNLPRILFLCALLYVPAFGALAYGLPRVYATLKMFGDPRPLRLSDLGRRPEGLPAYVRIGGGRLEPELSYGDSPALYPVVGTLGQARGNVLLVASPAPLDKGQGLAGILYPMAARSMHAPRELFDGFAQLDARFRQAPFAFRPDSGFFLQVRDSGEYSILERLGEFAALLLSLLAFLGLGFVMGNFKLLAPAPGAPGSPGAAAYDDEQEEDYAEEPYAYDSAYSPDESTDAFAPAPLADDDLNLDLDISSDHSAPAPAFTFAPESDVEPAPDFGDDMSLSLDLDHHNPSHAPAPDDSLDLDDPFGHSPIDDNFSNDISDNFSDPAALDDFSPAPVIADAPDDTPKPSGSDDSPLDFPGEPAFDLSPDSDSTVSEPTADDFDMDLGADDDFGMDMGAPDDSFDMGMSAPDDSFDMDMSAPDDFDSPEPLSDDAFGSPDLDDPFADSLDPEVTTQAAASASLIAPLENADGEDPVFSNFPKTVKTISSRRLDGHGAEALDDPGFLDLSEVNLEEPIDI